MQNNLKISLIQDVIICGLNDHAIDNPFRWYESSILQIAYNFARVQDNTNIITDIDADLWLNFVDDYGSHIFSKIEIDMI